MDKKSKIKELQLEIKKLELEMGSERIIEFQYLVGKYIHDATTSYKKITKINRVEDEEIEYDCIRIYYDDRGEEYNNRCDIITDTYSVINIDDLNRCLRTKEVFDDIFNKAIKLINKRINE